jgi:hypothetical protein
MSNLENLPKIKNIVKKLMKDGTIKQYIYDQKVYNDTYYSKNKGKLLEKKECELCKGTYCSASKGRHLKSVRHQKFLTNSS